MKPRMPSETKPGDLCDRKGVPIYTGDLLKQDHFTDRRRRKWFLYHVVTQSIDGVLHVTPTRWLAMAESERYLSGGQCYLHTLADADGVLRSAEVISGFGPNGIDWATRPRRKVTEVSE